ncbi:MAG: LPS assembly lipoprotein LptE, partial [Kiritimatiellaeota bacterium]|nr:LPS assembly lipoprotein LptE [Kiritimatiellota bacterium]
MNEITRGCRKMKMKITVLFSMVLISLLSGCANYKLGTTLSEELRAVYVPTVINKTAQPMADAELTRALMREIQREGTLRITDRENATTRLDVEITDYRQDSIRFRNNTSPEEYRMVLRATAVF